MSERLSIVLATEPVERIAAEVIVAFCFEDDLPLRGPAGRADWRLCGDLSRFVAASAAAPAGGALLLPTAGRLRTGRLMLLPLGAVADFDPDACARAVRDAAGRALDLGARSVALGPPGDWTDRIPVGIGAQACVRGAVAALEGTGVNLEIRLLTPSERVARVLRGLEAATSAMESRGVSIVLPSRDHGGTPLPAVRAGRTGTHPNSTTSQA